MIKDNAETLHVSRTLLELLLEIKRCKISYNVSDLDGRTALVTGSTSGIGLGIVHGLANKGCNIIFTGLGDENYINQLQKDLSK